MFIDRLCEEDIDNLNNCEEIVKFLNDLHKQYDADMRINNDSFKNIISKEYANILKELKSKVNALDCPEDIKLLIELWDF